jgi:hypothetical protein
MVLFIYKFLTWFLVLLNRKMTSHVSVESGTNTTSDDQLVQTPTRREKVWEHFEQELVEINGVI